VARRASAYTSQSNRGKALAYNDAMDLVKMLDELREERERIDEAIVMLERLSAGRGKRRGRPPAWMTEVKRRGRPPGSRNKPKAVAAGQQV